MLKYLNKIIPRFVKNQLIQLLCIKMALTPITKRSCNICDFKGYFKGFGRPYRLDARCPKCGSLERHRLLMLGIQRGEIEHFKKHDNSILHFAPEPILEKIFREQFDYYKTADLIKKADIKLNLENISLEDKKYDIVIANHVLEHVDDQKASSEIYRILKDEGVFVCEVPLIEGWEKTYENDEITDERDRLIHFGQEDHVRFYGKDFRDRIKKNGFILINEITAEGEDVINFGLIRGEKVFIFKKK
jgi:SAM-dependent methyltransferase